MRRGGVLSLFFGVVQRVFQDLLWLGMGILLRIDETMREVLLDELFSGLDGVRITAGDASGVMVRGITEDSRLVEEGWLFVARKGERFDGRLFIDEAIDRGAVAVMIESDGESYQSEHSCVRMVMDNAAEVTSQVAERFFGRPSKALTLIGITGTNGKTTTAHLIYDMLNRAGRKCGLIGTVSVDDGRGLKPAELTTPFAIDLSRTLATMVKHGCTHGVMEVSSHALTQGRVSGLHFTGGIFTNLSGDHLDYHGTMEKYAEAKAILFRLLDDEANQWAVVNVDDEASGRMMEACGSHVKLIRVQQRIHEATSDWSVSIENITTNGMGLLIRCGNDEQPLHTTLVGVHNAMNLLEACAAVVECGVSFTEVCDLAASCNAPPGRLEPVTAHDDPTGLMVLVDYAHTDDALANVLTAVRPIVEARGGRLVVVFGCGGDRDKSKRQRMMNEACAGADVVMVTSDNPRTEDADAIVQDILAGMDELEGVHVETDRRNAIRQVIEDVAGDNDVVVIAGKGHEDYQITGRVKHAFDDRVIARYALLRRLLRHGQVPGDHDDIDVSNIFWSFGGICIATGGRLMNVPGCGVQTTQMKNDGAISGISIDSRTIQKDEAFIAIRGENFDGHDFVEKAFTRGARLAVVSRTWWEHNSNTINRDENKAMMAGRDCHTFLVVEDTTTALGDVASVWRECLFNSGTTVVGITGSCGKTTTKEILNSVLSECKRGSAGIKSYNNEIGVPLTILAAEVDDEYLIVEVGSNSPGEIHALGSITRPDIAIITNVGRSHLAGFGSVEGVAREKAALLSTLVSENSWAVCPADSVEIRPIVPNGIRVIWFGESTGADLRLVDEELIENKSGWETLFTLEDNSKWHLPVAGKHFVLDGVAVIAVAREMGMNDEDIQSGLLKMKLPAMRMEVVSMPNGIRMYNDAYNANPESTLASIYTFLKMTSRVEKNHRILILGEMLELGSAAIPCHREIMLKVARMAQRQLIGRAIFVGSAYREASGSGIRFGCALPKGPVLDWVESIDDEEALARLASVFEPGDMILLKGSRRVVLERVITYCQQGMVLDKVN